jgi:DNA-binding transcriptional MerR regulator
MSHLTLKQLAEISGVTVRTLHDYDEIGLLKPASVGANGYRYYGREQLLRLQRILFHRELGVPLSEIARLLDLEEEDPIGVLLRHREKLVAERERYRILIETLDRTLAELRGETTMSNADLYRGFSPEKQAGYEAWLIASCQFPGFLRLPRAARSFLATRASRACSWTAAITLAQFAGGVGQTASPQEPAACPLPRYAEPMEFMRAHQIPTRPAPDDPTHKMVTPGGMVLETPKMVAAVDVLRVEARDASTMCFSLTTVGRDHQRCEIAGVAHISSDSATYVFREHDVQVRFRFQDEGEVRVEPEGEGYRSQCEPRGGIEPGVYRRT